MKRWSIIAWVMWLALVGQVLSGDAPRKSSPPASLQFRRVFAPADNIAQWPLGGEPFLPIEASEFERLVRAAEQSDVCTPGTEGVQLVAAEYHGRLGPGEDVLQGEATLTLTGQAARSTFLPLEPLGLAIVRAVWEGEASRAAALGRNAEGHVGVLVEQPGRLKLTWSLRGQRGPQGELAFPFELPRCATNHLLLDLDESLIPSVERGVIDIAPPATPGMKSWRIEMGGTHRSVVRLTKAGAPERQTPALLRQTVSYEFSPRGVDVTAQLHIDVQGKPLRQLTVELDPRLRLVAAQCAEKDIPWTATDAAPGGTRVILDFPEPISGTGRTVRLSALASLDEQQNWRLPQVRVDGMAWLEGTLVLVVPKPLVLDRITAVGCRQSKASPLAAPLSGESLEFQCFRDDASVDLLLTRPTENLHVDTGSLVDMGTAGIYCRTVAEISLRQDEQFTVSADLGPKWLIDTVEAKYPAIIADWQVDSDGGGAHRLVVALKQSVSARQPLTLEISGHRVAAPANGLDSGLGLSELEMLHFVKADFGRHWMAIRAADAHELRIKGAGDLTRIDPQRLTPAESSLFPETPTGLVFAVDPSAARLEVATVPRKPTYTGDINVDVVADGKTLTETYTLRCASPSARVERVLLFCSHARPEPLHFTVAGASGGQITAKRVPPDDLAASRISKGGEVWELTLRLPRIGPFEIRAVRSIPFTGPLPLSLAALPEASTQRGTLTVRALGETGINIDVDNLRLRLIPAELAASELYPTTRGAYRYEPDEPLRDASSAIPAIRVQPVASPAAEAGAWAWRSNLESRYALRDATLHMATWYVQTAGRSRVSFSLPSGAELRGVAIDDAPLPDALVSGFGSRFSIDLPPGKQFATVVLSFVAEGRLPRLAGSLVPAWPEIDIPVLARHWKIWLPPGYELAASDQRWETSPIAPPSWSQRLFGPLGRPDWQTVFHPLRLADWSSLLAPRDEIGTLNVERFSQALGNLVSTHAADSHPLSWGRLCDLLAASPAVSGFDVLVDIESLDQIGLRADSVVPRIEVGTETESGETVVDRAELFLLYNDQFVVLTTAAAVAGQTTGMAIDRSQSTGSLLPGPLTDEIETSARDGGATRYVPLAIWSRLSAGPDTPWRRETSSATGLWASRGWNATTLAVGSRIDQPVSIVRPAAMQSLAWAVFLLMLSIGIWQKGAGRIWLVASVLVLAATTLVASATFAPLTAAAFLASLCALAWSTVDRRQSRTATDRSARQIVPSLAVPVLILSSLSLSFGAAMQCWAEEPAISSGDNRSAAEDPLGTSRSEGTTFPRGVESIGAVLFGREGVMPGGAAAPPRVYRVFVPVDAEKQPVGTKLYLPEELYRGLSQRAARAIQQPGDWLMTRASYQLLLSRENASQTVAVAECKAIFDLEVFHAGAELSIPLGSEGFTLVRGSAKLDGRPIDIDRPRNADRLSLVADQAGMVRLEVSFAPKIVSDGATAGFDFSIPALPMSSLVISFAGEPVRVDVPTALGLMTPLSTAGLVQAELGPSSHLAVRWPEDKRAASTRPNVDVEELLWLKLQAGSPVIDARFKCHAAEGQIRHLRVLADPRLQLLPAAGGVSPITAIHATPGDPVTLDLDLSGEVDQTNHEVIVDLAFLVTGTSGIGNFHLPRLEATGVRSSGRLLAVSLDSSLHYEEPLDDDIKPQSSADFLAAWGTEAREPQLVYTIPQGMATWQLATRPTEVRNSVEQLTICSFGQGSASVHCSAALMTSSGHNFQLRLMGPPGLEIQNVSLVEGGVQRVARWATDNTGAITVFLTGPVSGRQQFSLEGRLPAPRTGDVKLPGFQWLDAEVKKNQVEIFRQAATLVEMGETTGVSSVEATAEERLKPEWGRLVASYTLNDPQATLSVHLAPNQPQVEGRQVLIVDRDHDSWTATIDLQLHVHQGLVDVLRFDVPPQWTEPYQDARRELLPIPSENRRQLVIRPLSPISGDYSLRVTGQLVPSMGDRLGVADVILRGLGQLERFVVLPQRWEREEVVWDTAGLAPATLPNDLQKRLALPAGMLTYHVLGEHFQASLKTIEHTPSSPRVQLADIYYAWQADGDYYGVGAFELSPASASTAIVELPPGMTLVSLAVADLPAAVVPAGPQGWQFSLGPPQLPQHVEVVFRGNLANARASSGPLRFEAPTLAGLKVDKTLWTVYGPASAGRGDPVETSAMTATGQELERLEATKAVLGLAAHVASEQMPEEMNRWHSLWKGRFLAARSRVGRLALTNSQPAARGDLEAWTREEAEIATRLGIAETEPAVLGAPAFEPLQILAANVAADPSFVGCKFMGSATTLTVRYPQTSQGDLGWRVLASIVLSSLALVLVWRRPAIASIRLSSPRMLALIGVCWWLWLAPSVVGFAILLGTLLFALAGRLRSASSTGLTTLPTG